MAPSEDGPAGAVDLCGPIPVRWASHSMAAGFPGELPSEHFKGQEAEAARPVKGFVHNYGHAISSILLMKATMGPTQIPGCGEIHGPS